MIIQVGKVVLCGHTLTRSLLRDLDSCTDEDVPQKYYYLLLRLLVWWQGKRENHVCNLQTGNVWCYSDRVLHHVATMQRGDHVHLGEMWVGPRGHLIELGAESLMHRTQVPWMLQLVGWRPADSMQQIPFREADSRSAGQQIPALM